MARKLVDEYDKGKLTRKELRKEITIGKESRSYEYSQFMKETVVRKSWYEKLCKRVGNLISLPLSKSERETLEYDILSSGLNIKPKEVMGLSIAVLIIGLFVSVLVIVISSSLFSFALLPLAFYAYTYVKNYPKNIAKKRILETTSEMVLGILYIVIYMRHTPNLEGAIKFASKNLTGPLGNDFKNLLWNVQTKKSRDLSGAINGFLTTWSDRNPPFVDAMHLVLSSLHQINNEMRKETLDQAVDTVLNGTYETMVKYANKLRTPVQAVSLIGITLPIMGLVMLPMISAFMSDLITPELIFVFYDIILPIVILFFINRVLGSRPVGFPVPDISGHPNVPPKGKFYLTIQKNKISVPTYIIPIIVFVFFAVLFGLYIYSVQGLSPSRNDVFGSLTIVIGLMFGMASYFYLSSFQKIKIRNTIGGVEDEFTNAAYIMSNMMSEGKPIETTLIKTAKEMKSYKIHSFFDKISRNIQQLGMDVERAIFDPKEGAIKLYPSMLVNSIMRILVSSSDESTEAAAMSMRNIGIYTKAVHKINEKIKDILSETISSLVFQANFIAPLITGVVVGLSTMIFLILDSLGTQIGGLATGGGDMTGGAVGMNVDFLLGFLNLSSSVDVWAFQPIVGVYLIIVVTLMIYLINRVEFGGDNIQFMSRAAKTLVMSTLMYIVIVSVTTMIFTGLADMAVVVGV